MAKVTIIGGHGKISLLLSAILTGRGDEVTALIRNEAHSADVAATGARPEVFDVETATPDDFAATFTGQDAVVFSAGAGGGDPSRTYAVDRDAAIASMSGAEKAGVSRYVMVSYLGARVDHGVSPDHGFFAYAEAKATADAALRQSTLAWTILQPGQLTLSPPTGTIDPGARSGEGNPETSRGNVAQVAAAALAAPNTVGRDIPFTDGAVPITAALAAF